MTELEVYEVGFPTQREVDGAESIKQVLGFVLVCVTSRLHAARGTKVSLEKLTPCC